MKISDRDKKIIVIIFIALVVALPYLFIIKPTNEKITGVEGEIATLQARYDELKALEEQRGFYESEIVRMNKESDDIIASYAPGIRQENIIMFLRGLEFNIPVAMNTVSFSGNAVTPVLAGTTDENGNVTGAVNAIKTQTSVAYVCEYTNIKDFLAYILANEEENNERMVVSSVDIEYDSATGKVSGSFVLDQFAVTGDDRELAPAVIPAIPHGNESIFGTYISDEELREELEAADGEGEEAAEE